MEVGPTNSVLVVEDQPVSQMVISHQLHKLGYEGDIVTNGHGAIDRFAHGEYLLVLMDCHLPGLDGFLTTWAMQRIEKVQDRYIPIVALTARNMVGDREMCLAAGMDDYLSKPVELEKLRTLCNRWTKPLDEADRLITGKYPPVDLNVIKQTLGGLKDEAALLFLDEAIEDFIQNTPQLVQELREAVIQDMVLPEIQAVYGLISASTTIGAISLARLVRKTLRTWTPGQPEQTQKDVEDIESEYKRIHEALQARKYFLNR